MTNRSPITVALLSFFTLGIYGLVWTVKTKGEMNKLGADIPTAWLGIIPLVNIYWFWKYCQGVEKVTGGRLGTILAFVVVLLLGFIGYAIVQDAFNKVGAPAAPSAAATPPPPPPA
ncbi:MAG: DUF4234 domain-containing protein [Acidimicrobiia bacterium]|nr:DUF4234 domain-containing protein [Acidimicrobiia bacterium]